MAHNATELNLVCFRKKMMCILTLKRHHCMSTYSQSSFFSCAWKKVAYGCAN